MPRRRPKTIRSPRMDHLTRAGELLEQATWDVKSAAALTSDPVQVDMLTGLQQLITAASGIVLNIAGREYEELTKAAPERNTPEIKA